MNKLDAELSLGLLQEEGYRIIDKAGEADVILFDTCSVHQHAEDKVYSHPGALKNSRKRRPEIIVITNQDAIPNTTMPTRFLC